ncbi:MAG: molybdenum ABC transporter ATP-binding protein [Parvibaculaceae bacterium]
MSANIHIDISRTLPDFRLSVAFDAGPGTTGILGPSGAGKSMLLSAIAGLVAPDEGGIEINGRHVFDRARSINLPPEERSVGMVFQDPRLFPHMSVRTNLTFSKRVGHGPLATLEEIVSLLNLAHLLDRRPHHLSGGEKQRVAIGRALLSSPSVLLMDEPLSSLDPARRREVMPFLESLTERFDIPLLYVSHNLEETIRLADRVVVLDQGRIFAQGAVEDVLSQVDVQTLVLGDDVPGDHPEPVTIAGAKIARHHDDGLTTLDTPWGDLSAPGVSGAPDHRVRIRVRARDIVLATSPPEGLSIRNVIPGEIGVMTEAGPAQVDVLIHPAHSPEAPPLWARITQQAALQLDLQPGKPVWALLKAVVLATDIDLDALR